MNFEKIGHKNDTLKLALYKVDDHDTLYDLPFSVTLELRKILEAAICPLFPCKRYHNAQKDISYCKIL